ncbi:MAG: hypothetical protein ACXAC0_04445 [Candidatus Thorarchaeota archaeon]
MGKRAIVSVDWLRKGRMVEDLTILRNLIADSSAWKVETAKLDEMLFEGTFGLQPLPQEPSTGVAINRAIGHEEVTDKMTTKMRPLIPFGDTVKEQVASLFPDNLTETEEDTLAYVFSRFVLEDTPKDIEWPLVPEGLDSLSAALFTINIVSRLIGGENPWLLPLWSMKVEEYRILGLQKIYDSLLSEDKLDDVIEHMESTKESIKEILVQNRSIDHALAPQDPLSYVIDRWLRTLRGKKDSAKRIQEETRQKIATESMEEIRVRKGAGPASLDEADLQRLTLTQWNIHALRPDGPSSSGYESMLTMFRGNLNILDYEPLVKVCEYLSDCERAGRPSASEIEKAIGTKRRMSHYTLQRLGMILTERYIPPMKKLGLRYRFIFTEKQKPIVLSDGHIERMVLSESSHEGCTVHLEPEISQGPSGEMPSNTIQMTVDSELISMRLDLYDKKNKTWKLEPWKSASRRPGRTSSWLLRETQYDQRSPRKLTNREIDLLGPTLAFRGLRASRMWMMERMDFVPRTARRYLRRMLDDKILRLLYTPALEYCGLPEGMLAVGEFKEHRSRESFIDWMTSRIPFVRIFTDKSTNMVAHIRLPAYKTDVVGGVIREKLSGGSMKDRITSQSFTARLRSYKTYHMTALQRLMHEKGFIDPWEK